MLTRMRLQFLIINKTVNRTLNRDLCCSGQIETIFLHQKSMSTLRRNFFHKLSYMLMAQKSPLLHQLRLVLLLMEESLHQLVRGLSMFIPSFTRFIHSRWCRISSINSTTPYMYHGFLKKRTSNRWLFSLRFLNRQGWPWNHFPESPHFAPASECPDPPRCDVGKGIVVTCDGPPR